MYTCERLAGTRASTIGNFKRYVFFADKIFVIRPYRFKFISVMECIRDEFIFKGLHVYSYSGELSFLFGFVVNTLMYLFNKEYRCLGNNERWFGISFIYITFTGKGWGGYCYLLLCIDFRNYLLLNMKKNQDIFFLNCSVYFIYIDFHSIMIFFMYVRCYDWFLKY